MSCCFINIRILFWHFKLETDYKFSVDINPYWWRAHRLKAVLLPVAVYDFRLIDMIRSYYETN